MNNKFERLRQGRSPVIEKGHLVVLGWSSKVPAIVREFALSEERVRRVARRRRPRIVLLVPRVTPDEIDRVNSALRDAVGRVKVLFRSGNPLLAEDLSRIRVQHASTVAIPALDAGPETTQIDTRTLKTLLSFDQVIADQEDHQGPNIVIELTYALNRDLAQTVCTRPELQILPGDEVVSRVVAQTVRHPGLSGVFSELLTHNVGNEIYMVPTPRRLPSGIRYHQLLQAFREAVPIGLKRDDGNGRRIQINPDPNVEVNSEDEVVVISREKRSRMQRLRGVKPQTLEPARLEPATVPKEVQQILILGWNSKVTAVLRELETYRSERFAVTIISRRSGAELN